MKGVETDVAQERGAGKEEKNGSNVMNLSLKSLVFSGCFLLEGKKGGERTHFSREHFCSFFYGSVFTFVMVFLPGLRQVREAKAWPAPEIFTWMRGTSRCTRDRARR